MEGKEAIIKKIIDDAENKGDLAIENAKKSAEKMCYEADLWASEYTSHQNEILDKEIKDIFDRKVISANLENRKNILKAKQDFIDEVFDEVKNRLNRLDKKDYLKLVLKSIKGSADFGDLIVISKDGIISEKDLETDDFIVKNKLSVSKEKGDFSGGVKLVGKNSDKDLTFSAIVDSIKDDFCPIISAEVFK